MQDSFQAERLVVARAEIVRLDGLIADEENPKRLRDLYSALDSASERERRLSGRSLPPTIRAPSKSPRQRPGQGSFHEPEVLPDPVANPPAIETPKPATDTPTGGVQ